MMKKSDLVLFLLILIFAFLLGSRMILSGDFFYLFDQARDYMIVQNIIQTHAPILIGTHSGLGGFFHGPLWIYLLIPIYLIGHGSPLSFAYFYIFLQLVTISIAFLAGLKLYGSRGGILISFLVALSPVTWSTVPNTIGVNMMPLVFIGLFYFLIKFVRGDSNSFIFAAFFTGLSLQFETALPLILIPAVMIIFFFNRIAIKNLKVIILSIFAFLLSISSFILFDLRHKFLMSRSVLGAFVEGHKEKGYLDWGHRLYEHLQSLISTHNSLLFRDNLVLTLLFLAIMISGIHQVYKNKSYNYRKEFWYLLLFPILIFTIFMLYPYKIWPEYVLGLVVPIALVFYLSIILSWKNIFGKILVGMFFAITLFYVAGSIGDDYLNKYPESVSSGSYKNQKAVVEWMFKDKSNGESGYLVYTPETYTHGMDYLIPWYGKNYPKIDLKNTKEKTTYLIMYPHLSTDDKAYEFWKKNVVRTSGRVIAKKFFRGNITVEKLSIENQEPAVDPNYYQGLLFR